MRRTALALLAALLAAPAAAQVAPLGLSQPEALDGDVSATGLRGGEMYQFRSGADEMRLPQIGRGVGAAEENATAFRGPYGFGQCPAGTLLTTFGTCADERRR